MTLSADPDDGDGSVESYAFTVMVNGIASVNTCTISNTDTTCTSPSGVALSVSDTVNVRIVGVEDTSTVTVTSFSATYGTAVVPIG